MVHSVDIRQNWRIVIPCILAYEQCPAKIVSKGHSGRRANGAVVSQRGQLGCYGCLVTLVEKMDSVAPV